MIATEAVQRVVILVRKYGLYLLVPIFLLAALIYVDSTTTEYKVTARITSKNEAPEDIIRDLGSRPLIQKAIAELPLQASYYDDDSPRDEVYGDSLRLKLVFLRPVTTDEETQLQLADDSSGLVALTHVDTTAYYQFDKPIHESYGDFRIIHATRADHSPVSYTVILQNPTQVFAEYSKNLRFESNDADGSVNVSVLAGNPKKGVDLLNRMLSLYRESNHVASRYAGIGNYKALRSHLIILDKPENNIEQTSVNPFWIYLIALVAGLLAPVAFSVIKSSRKKGHRFRSMNFPKLAGRIQQYMPAKQLD